MSKRWWREFWWAFTHSGPYSDYARGLGDRAQACARAEAGTLRNCAYQIDAWANFDASLPEAKKTELKAIVRSWFAVAEELDPESQVQR